MTRNRDTKLLPVNVGKVCDGLELSGLRLVGMATWSSNYLVIKRLLMAVSFQDQRA